jgi:hypothetical protein
MLKALAGRWRAYREAMRPPDREDGRCALAEIADRALAIQPAADEVIGACGRPRPIPGEVGQRGGPLVTEFWRLRQQAIELVLPVDLQGSRDQLVQLLEYHQLMVYEALRLAFTTTVSAEGERVRERLTGLGSPAGALREFRAALPDPVGR